MNSWTGQEGHIRLCAGCNREVFLSWVPPLDVLPGDPPPFLCRRCRKP